MAEKMLSPEEVADLLAVSPNTVRGWLRNGTLKGVKLGKKIWRIKEVELQTYLNRIQGDEYNGVNDEEELSSEDLKAVRRGLEDIKDGRVVTLSEYEQGKRP